MTQSLSRRCWKLGLTSSLAIGEALATFLGNYACAQVIPDATLGAEHSIVTPLTPSVAKIDGGARREKFFFHSFQEFNISENQEVYFTNSAGVENILSRVTGNNSSNIFGKLGVLGGNANLFLINPNEIIFGPHASLDVMGSFVATTANAVQFGAQGFFNASTPNVPPLLTVNPSALLVNQIGAGSITNNSLTPAGQRANPFATSGVKSLLGLRVPDGRSLLLAGGNVTLDGGGVNALGGRVELGGLAGAGTIGLDVNGNNLHLSFPDGAARADISLIGANVDTSGEGGGDIQIQGRHVTLTDGSQVVSTTLGSKPGGTLAVTASDSLELIGPKATLITTETKDAGNAGDITINAGKLLVQAGAQVLTGTGGIGAGGKLTVNVSQSVELIGSSPDGFNSSLLSLTFATGDAGDISINTRRLMIRDGAAISADSTYGTDAVGNVIQVATGRGGNVTLNALDLVELTGKPTGGLVSTDTSGSAEAGNIKINTGRLLIQDGGQISSNTYGKGRGGTLTVNASSVELRGISADGKSPSLLSTSTDSPFFNNTEGTGDAGKLTITTEKLNVLDGAEVAVNHIGKESGNAGKLEIAARSIRLDNQGKLTSGTESGQGGDINLHVQDLLLMRHSSQISATAGTAQAGGNGGNITINNPFIVAIPSENSKISANAFRGNGGQVTINAQGIFGTQFQAQPTPESDITASSTGGGINGVVSINRLNINPSFGLVTLPVVPVDVAGLIAQGCPANVGPRASKFIVTGRGGLPENPSETLSSDAVQVDLVTLNPKSENRSVTSVSTQPTSATSAPLVEATGWVIGANGQVTLTAQATTLTPRIPWLAPGICHVQ